MAEINQILGTETSATTVPTATAETPAPVSRRGRGRKGGRGANTMSMRAAVLKALEKGPLARKELVPAVEATGYKFTTRKPLNSIGAILYGKNSPVKSKDGKFYVEGGSYNGNGMKNDMRKPAKTKRKMSAEGRAKIAATARKRWAKVRAGK